MNKDFVFSIDRVFDASRERVWKAWTTQDNLQMWFGPKGCPISYCKLELREGGTFHYCMKVPGGGDMWGRWVFKQLQEPERLEFVSSFSDPEGGLTRHPLHMEWPLELYSVVTFTDMGGKTKVKVEWTALNATEIECETFEKGQVSMQNGWTGTFEQFEAYLKKGL